MMAARGQLRQAAVAALTLALLMILASLNGVEATASSSSLTSRSGSAGWAVESLGSSYLAIPEGPGYRVRISGSGGSLIMVSNDAGPALSEQRKGRIADIAVRKWEFICGLDRSRGRCQVTIEYLDGTGPTRTLPPTDQKEVLWIIRSWRLFSQPS